MLAKVKLQNLRIAPRKVRLVADLIRKKSVEEAQTILNFTTKKAAPILLKLLRQAIINAKNTLQIEEKNLYISKILVNEGPKYKRWMPRARGMASEIQKKTSHITLILDEIIKKPKKLKKIKETHPQPVEGIEKIEKISETERPIKEGKPAARETKPKAEIEMPKPKIEKGIRRIFRRKAF